MAAIPETARFLPAMLVLTILCVTGGCTGQNALAAEPAGDGNAMARRERAAWKGGTVEGPESDKLVPAATGYVLIDRERREITAIELPSLRETIIRPRRPADRTDDATIHALSGPDADGRIAYIEDHFFVAKEKERRHLLKTIKLDGTEETELFTRPGGAMWATSAAGKGEIGRHLALAPVGGRVAFVSGLKPVQMPTALLQAGSIEIWDVEKKAGGRTEIKAIDGGLAWFPDGKRLAYVKLVEPEAVHGWHREGEEFGEEFRRWEKVPAVFIRDIDGGRETLLHVGGWPVVSLNGGSVLVGDNQGVCNVVDVATGKSKTVSWPGKMGYGAIAMPAKDVALSLCLPTKGGRIEFTENNSPLVGPRQMVALKLVRLGSEEFQTVVPSIDPRRLISFGRMRKDSEE